MMETQPTTTAPFAANAPTVRSAREIYLVMSGLMIAMLLAMLDNMVVGTAMPTIVGELGGLTQLAWVVTAYTLATAVSTPVWGKLGDLYGRKGMFMASIVIFLVGSALAGMAQSMGELIAFRGVQGLGAGGLVVGAIAIIGDLVPPRERARYQGLITAVMPLAMIGGPLIGGFCADHLTWRWAFFINLPLGALALLVIGLTMHLPKRRTSHRIDYLGIVLLTAGVTTLILVVTWGGIEYAWNSVPIIGLVIASVVSLVAFVHWELRATEPILPMRLFRNANFSLVSMLGFLLGFAMFASVTFLPQFQQLVQGVSATNSGLLLLPMIAGILVTMIVVGQLITRTGRYRVYPIIGGILMTAGMLLLARLATDTSILATSLFMIVLGVGTGLLMQNTVLIAQNSVDTKDMGTAIGVATLFRAIGGALGLSLLGAIYGSRVTDGLTARLGPEGEALAKGGNQVTPAMVKQLPDDVREAFTHAVTSGMNGVFLWGAGLSAIAFAIAWFIREVPMYSGQETVECDDRSPTAVVAEAEPVAMRTPAEPRTPAAPEPLSPRPHLRIAGHAGDL